MLNGTIKRTEQKEEIKVPRWNYENQQPIEKVNPLVLKVLCWIFGVAFVGIGILFIIGHIGAK